MLKLLITFYLKKQTLNSYIICQECVSNVGGQNNEVAFKSLLAVLIKNMKKRKMTINAYLGILNLNKKMTQFNKLERNYAFLAD